ncbi:hypothetical protein M427DRAFT_235115 [Gonapodya prolifera JEL478]|uniref:Uncharacterized protein n=1 Tax=Gonapodya prolifera (strain JEL478) TaxID=1344416 RepID=A0A139AMA7_GONPJ|nr:hypothetical protein M427DRAFT_235115 [Gonapodya prolifera JEL478]|eukprot:KXS17907.1 hypothetical protein M427DRAFT_235115 [Gonapodya prolifera JEL478]
MSNKELRWVVETGQNQRHLSHSAPAPAPSAIPASVPAQGRGRGGVTTGDRTEMLAATGGVQQPSTASVKGPFDHLLHPTTHHLDRRDHHHHHTCPYHLPHRHRRCGSAGNSTRDSHSHTRTRVRRPAKRPRTRAGARLPTSTRGECADGNGNGTQQCRCRCRMAQLQPGLRLCCCGLDLDLPTPRNIYPQPQPQPHPQPHTHPQPQPHPQPGIPAARPSSSSSDFAPPPPPNEPAPTQVPPARRMMGYYARPPFQLLTPSYPNANDRPHPAIVPSHASVPLPLPESNHAEYIQTAGRAASLPVATAAKQGAGAGVEMRLASLSATSARGGPPASAPSPNSSTHPLGGLTTLLPAPSYHQTQATLLSAAKTLSSPGTGTSGAVPESHRLETAHHRTTPLDAL